jgi:hypothetical protein
MEDDFMSGARLNPKTDGRPDPRPTVRENVKILGNITNDFNFNQKPRAPVLLPTNPPTDFAPPYRDTEKAKDPVSAALPRRPARRGSPPPLLAEGLGIRIPPSTL